jgi:hypothetical protein
MSVIRALVRRLYEAVGERWKEDHHGPVDALPGGPVAGRVELDHPVVDVYLELVRARCRPNTVLATAYDLKVFSRSSAGTRWR